MSHFGSHTKNLLSTETPGSVSHELLLNQGSLFLICNWLFSPKYRTLLNVTLLTSSHCCGDTCSLASMFPISLPPFLSLHPTPSLPLPSLSPNLFTIPFPEIWSSLSSLSSRLSNEMQNRTKVTTNLEPESSLPHPGNYSQRISGLPDGNQCSVRSALHTSPETSF